ncbi:MAG: heavy metal-binding domain-containing protein [Bdellovibrionia bacterium]
MFELRISNMTSRIDGNIRFVAALGILLLSSCSTGGHLRTADSSRSPAKTSPSEIKIYSTSNIGRPYETIGAVVANADGGNDSSQAIKELRNQASLIGADAVVGLRLEVNEGFWEASVRATGLAVRFGDQQ